MRSLVIGYGSIGQRHALLLAELEAAPAVVSRRRVDGIQAYTGIAEALSAHQPELVVIANETSAHLDAVQELADLGFGGRVLVEKPLFANPAPLPANRFADLRVGYNLRCHPLVAALRDRLDGAPRLVQAAAGQYLPDWRKGREWQRCYSADPVRGGGVLRDLSHELDLLLWLCGPVRDVAALGGKSDLLPIASDGHWSILAAFENGAQASLQLDYLNRPGRRFLAAEQEGGSVAIDFLAGTITVNGEVQSISVPRNESYRRQLKAMLSGKTDHLCDAAGGLAVVELIALIEHKAKAGWT